MSAGYEVVGTERFGVRRGEVALWAVSFVVVLAAQSAAALFVSSQLTPARPPGAPEATIVIDLAPIDVAPEPEPTLEAESEPLPAVETPVPVPVETVTPIEPVEPAAVAQIEPLPALEPEPIEPEPVSPVDEVEPVVPETFEETIPDLIESETAEVSIPLPLVVPQSIAEKRQEFAEAKPKPRPKTPAKPKTVEKKVEPKEAKPVTKPVDSAPAVKKSSVSPERWQAQVVTHVSRSKRYPASARSNREEGVARVRFLIDSRGRVLSAAIVKSSGSSALDEAALATVRRASPVPSPPSSMGSGNISLTVPIAFALN